MIISIPEFPLLYIVAATIIHLSVTQSALDQCHVFASCESCFSVEGCQWCFNQGGFMCLSSDQCPRPGPINSEVMLCEEPLGFDNQVSVSTAVFKLLPGDTKSLEFLVERNEDSPLDFYMLIDLSNSLSDDLHIVQSLSRDIVQVIHAISSDNLVGLGIFVDKLTYPYIGDGFLKFSGDPFDRPFSFTHLMNLNNDSDLFIEKIDDLRTSGNIDNPEGTFDALSQAVMCTELVGWRNDSVKIIFVITDAQIHMAGDGMLAGIARPSPKECRTEHDPQTDSFTYVDNTEFDYPSVGEILELLWKYSVVPIFTVTDYIRSYYDELGVILEPSGAQVITLTTNFDNLFETVESAYENVLSNVELRYETGGEELDIRIIANCPDDAIIASDGTSCSNVTIDQVVGFQVAVTLNQCTNEFQSGSRLILVTIPGYGQVKLRVKGIC